MLPTPGKLPSDRQRLPQHRRAPLSKRTVKTIAIVAGVVLFLICLRLLADVLFDFWWYAAAGYGSVYTRVLLTKVWLWFVGFALAFGAAGSGIVLARRRTSPGEAVYYRWGRWTFRVPSLQRLVVISCWVLAGLAGLVGGSAASAMWRRVLLFLNRVPFGVEDPIFQNDMGFYVFTYPILKILHPVLQVLAWLSLGLSIVVYFGSGAFAVQDVSALPRRVFKHLSRMVAFILVLTAAGYFLQRYSLLYSSDGVAYGAGYTDIKARLLAYWVMCIASLATAGVFFMATSTVWLKRVALALAAWAGCAVLFLGIVPPFLQWYRVEPNELELERPYISYAIGQTLDAYNLSAVDDVPYPVKEDLGYSELMAETDTVANIRLWDKGPLAAIYSEKQGLRPYYVFTGIAVDRYELEAGVTQTMLSVRELKHENLPERAQTWVNMRLQYTHGYGLCASPVNKHTDEGFPVLVVKDIPPVAVPQMEVKRPQVYYGRMPQDYVFVKTRTDEFDYPREGENAYTRYDGKGGVPVGSRLRKLVYALGLGDVKLLLSDDLVDGSRVLYYRTIPERVHRVAPYLRLDQDPYAVVHDGRIFWIQDAYTTSRYYPYSEPARGGRFNYIRNSVKAVVDAYDGTVSLYVADPEDPLIRAYQAAFPGVYQPMDEMPAALRRHVRYPRDLFDMQADKYRRYHMRDPRVFYNQEDVWEVPWEMYRGNRRPVQSYYITMRLPDSKEAEFVLMLPFTPRGRPNMVAWLAARCDAENYGELIAFLFPKQKHIYGPQQVEARIDQNPQISQQLTLWSQRGSEVTRGNLLVIPVARGILYVEPLYIQAETGAVPQLKRIITAYGEHVAMRASLEESLQALFQRMPAVQAPTEEEPAPAVPPEAVEARALLEQTLEAYELSQEALKEADWAEYGRQMQRIREALERLEETLPETGEP